MPHGKAPPLIFSATPGYKRTVPETFYDLFHGLAAAQRDFLLTGAIALALHGVPRLSDDADLLVEPSAGNINETRALIASWGYGQLPGDENAAPSGTRVIRLAHPTAPIGKIDLVSVAAETYAALRGRATVFRLIDVPIPAVSHADLLHFKSASPRPRDREDAASLRLLEEVLQGKKTGDPEDTRRLQIVKFQRWHTENRCEWLLAAMRTQRGLPPEVGPPHNSRLRREKPWRRP